MPKTPDSYASMALKCRESGDREGELAAVRELRHYGLSETDIGRLLRGESITDLFGGEQPDEPRFPPEEDQAVWAELARFAPPPKRPSVQILERPHHYSGFVRD